MRPGAAVKPRSWAALPAGPPLAVPELHRAALSVQGSGGCRAWTWVCFGARGVIRSISGQVGAGEGGT